VNALTVCQPWAWAIVEGHKTVENRRWTPHIESGSWIAIHAGKSTKWLDHGLRDLWSREINPCIVETEYGAIVGVVRYCGWVKPQEAHGKDRQFAFGPYCWILRDPVAIDPVPCSGAQGIWTVDDSVMDRVELNIAYEQGRSAKPRQIRRLGVP
jgi:hypothetical protein